MTQKLPTNFQWISITTHGVKTQKTAFVTVTVSKNYHHHIMNTMLSTFLCPCKVSHAATLVISKEQLLDSHLCHCTVVWTEVVLVRSVLPGEYRIVKKNGKYHFVPHSFCHCVLIFKYYSVPNTFSACTN